MSEEIEYEVTLTVKVASGQPDSAPRPFEEAFYASVPGEVHVARARRLTPATNYGGPK